MSCNPPPVSLGNPVPLAPALDLKPTRARVKRIKARAAGLTLKASNALLTAHTYTALSNPSKMPGRAWGLPARKTCPVGDVLATIKDSVCFGCYGDDRGNYLYSNVKASQQARLERVQAALESQDAAEAWAAAMVRQIAHYSPDWFRVHDAGDLFSADYFRLWLLVIRCVPGCRFWIPTREKATAARVLRGQSVPRNLSLRLSAAMLGGAPPAWPVDIAGPGLTSSTVNHNQGPQCPASGQGNACLDCRRCWSRSGNTNYPFHN